MSLWKMLISKMWLWYKEHKDDKIAGDVMGDNLDMGGYGIDDLQYVSSGGNLPIIANDGANHIYLVGETVMVSGEFQSNGTFNLLYNLVKNPKNHTATALSGTKKLIEIEISGSSYYFEVYPTKA